MHLHMRTHARRSCFCPRASVPRPTAPNVPPHREEAAISGEISGTLARPETLALPPTLPTPYPPISHPTGTLPVVLPSSLSASLSASLSGAPLGRKARAASEVFARILACPATHFRLHSPG